MEKSIVFEPDPTVTVIPEVVGALSFSGESSR
jgi:hypothetical protein